MEGKHAKEDEEEEEIIERTVKYTCLTDEDVVFTRKDDSQCSYNGKNYKFSKNNQHPDGDESLLAAEYAVFSGNLLRFILGPQQPKYYLACNEINTKFYRVSQQLDNYDDWQTVVTEDNNKGCMFFKWGEQEQKNILEVNIVGLIDLFVACHFLGEADWEGGNFGFINAANTFVAVRLDPGFSFNSFIIENNDISLERYIDNFVINYLIKEIAKEGDHYLTGIIDYEQEKFKNQAAAILFSNRERIVAVIRKIAEIQPEDLEKIKQRSFTASDFDQADKLIEKLIARIELYTSFTALLEVEGVEAEEKSNEYDDVRSVGEKRKRQVPMKLFDQRAESSSQDPSVHSNENTGGKNKRLRTETPANNSPKH